MERNPVVPVRSPSTTAAGEAGHPGGVEGRPPGWPRHQQVSSDSFMPVAADAR
ncbi:hypothetical protein [Saccharothrix xinjiangensis]|uniref:Uncharacterized protein n=1 Tax=Saccharothrix xinjiangensis TaxID=204798 RepID=A0ABV9Y413_9PSEU